MAQEEAQEAQLDEYGAMSFEDAMRDMVAKQADGPTEEAHPFTQDDEPVNSEEPQSDVEAQQEAQAEEAEAVPAEDSAEEEGGEKKNATADKSLARIMEKAAALEEKQRHFDESMEKLAELRSRVDAYEAAKESDPIELIRSVWPEADLKRLAERLWYEHQGDKAPQKYLQEKAAKQHTKELADRLAKVERAEQERLQKQEEQQAQEVFARYTGSLEAFARDAQEGDYPLLKGVYAKEGGKDAIHSWMLNAARSHAQQTGGQTMTPEEAAKAVENQLRFYQAQQATPPKNAQVEQKQSTSLRNSSQQVNPDLQPEDELSDDYLRRKAFEAIGRPDLT